NAVLAAKGFPVAFGPLHVPRGSGDPRYWDGGWFDNIPVGLAIELNKDVDKPDRDGHKPERKLAFMYVDASIHRGQPKPTRAPLKHGLALLQEQLGSRLDEARTYELQAVTRNLRKDDAKVQMTDSFFPLSAGTLPESFGAFFHPEFRRYDYLIGFYDA